MKGENSRAVKRQTNGRAGFRISGGPIVSGATPSAPSSEPGQLPSSYGAPILFAIPRDPRTIFTTWNIDWSDACARNAPADRQASLRLKREEGSDEIEASTEPMLGSHLLLVAQPRGGSQVELGLYD